MCRGLALPAANLGSTPSIPYGPQTLPGVEPQVTLEYQSVWLKYQTTTETNQLSVYFGAFKAIPLVSMLSFIQVLF